MLALIPENKRIHHIHKKYIETLFEVIVSSLTERHIVTAPGFRQHLHFFFWTRDASFVLAVYLSDLLYEV